MIRGMIQRILPSSLYARLMLAFGALALLTAVLANSASLALYGMRLERQERAAMANQASTLANLVGAVAGEEPLPAARLVRLLFTDVRLRRSLQPLMIVDAEGRPLASIAPNGPGRGPGAGPGLQRGGDRREPSASLRPPFVDPDLRFPPVETDAEGRPAVSEIHGPNGGQLLYTTVPLTLDIEADAPWTRFIGDRAALPLHLALVRPRAELRGLWRSLLPSVVIVGLAALGLAMLAAWLLARSIARPVAALTRASRQMAGGDYQVSVAEDDRAGELADLARSFNRMARAVAEADRRQRDFVVNVGHDLRTPLTTIRGFAEALSDGTARSPEQRERALSSIRSSSQRMTELVESLIDLARLEGQAGGLKLEQRSARDFLDSVIEAQQGNASLRGVSLETEVENDLELWLDPNWMRRAVGNLVENAIRHGPAGGRVTLRAATDRFDSGEPALRIEVRDEGPGIRLEDLPRIFERFYRGDPARSSAGSGLGLAIAREIVEAHGGQIHASNPREGGALLTVRLPYDRQ